MMYSDRVDSVTRATNPSPLLSPLSRLSPCRSLIALSFATFSSVATTTASSFTSSFTATFFSFATFASFCLSGSTCSDASTCKARSLVVRPDLFSPRHPLGRSSGRSSASLLLPRHPYYLPRFFDPSPYPLLVPQRRPISRSQPARHPLAFSVAAIRVPLCPPSASLATVSSFT